MAVLIVAIPFEEISVFKLSSIGMMVGDHAWITRVMAATKKGSGNVGDPLDRDKKSKLELDKDHEPGIEISIDEFSSAIRHVYERNLKIHARWADQTEKMAVEVQICFQNGSKLSQWTFKAKLASCDNEEGEKAERPKWKKKKKKKKKKNNNNNNNNFFSLSLSAKARWR
ncbi:hypothetical protein R1sor_023022 [Riccia sorocarpa]|uniref:Uncharacterized protein n=1 Tax=Riccia sorocarpa TaxID=122646 RepID=A0ABD3GQF3_9MARC